MSKRWLSKPAATVTQGGRLIAQAGAAESWLEELVGGNRDGGPSGLVRVRQGISELAGGSDKEQKAALDARRDLLSSVTGEVEAMTGGRRMDMAVSRCERELLEYATATGKPKLNGPWRAAQDRVLSLTESRDQLTATALALQEPPRRCDRSPEGGRTVRRGSRFGGPQGRHRPPGRHQHPGAT